MSTKEQARRTPGLWIYRPRTYPCPLTSGLPGFRAGLWGVILLPAGNRLRYLFQHVSLDDRIDGLRFYAFQELTQGDLPVEKFGQAA